MMSAIATSQAASPFKGRAASWEFTLGPSYIKGKTVDFDGGSHIDTNSNTGINFGIGYNYTDQLATNVQVAWSSSNFSGERMLDTGSTQAVSGTADVSAIQLNGQYYFLKGAITPYVVGGLGWTSIDTNIPTGPPTGVCWYDPWWGYICGEYQPTRVESFLSYNVGVGVRWDINRKVFLRASIGKYWINADNTSEADFDTNKLEIGFSFL